MLQMKSLARPNRQRLDHFQASAIGIVSGQPNQIQPRAQIGRSKNVSLFQRLAEQHRNPPRDFRQLAQIKQRAEHESLGHPQLPGRAGAAIAKDFGGAVAQLRGLFPVTHQISADAAGP